MYVLCVCMCVCVCECVMLVMRVWMGVPSGDGSSALFSSTTVIGVNIG